MVLQALDAFNISIVVGHHEDARGGKQARQSFRMGGANQTQVIVKPSLLLAGGANFVQGLKEDKALKPVLKSSRFGCVAEVGMQGLNILSGSEEARAQ